MAVLTHRANRIKHQDRWPTKKDIGKLVLLPGGEVGVLIRWWNAEDVRAWRWQVESDNYR
jgi:hypothetical protein